MSSSFVELNHEIFGSHAFEFNIFFNSCFRISLKIDYLHVGLDNISLHLFVLMQVGKAECFRFQLKSLFTQLNRCTT